MGRTTSVFQRLSEALDQDDDDEPSPAEQRKSLDKAMSDLFFGMGLINRLVPFLMTAGDALCTPAQVETDSTGASAEGDTRCTLLGIALAWCPIHLEVTNAGWVPLWELL
jgi:hypothetical protein